MKINGKNIKRGTIITVVSIIVLTLATMNVSYSSFFKVQTQNTVPVITAGNLNVTAQIAKAAGTDNKELMPSGGYKTITGPSVAIQGNDFSKSTLTVTNSSNIDIKLGVSLSDTANSGNATPASVVIAIQKSGQWLQFGSSGKYYVKLSELVKSGTAYPIISETVGKASPVYDIYMWLAEDAVEDDAEKALNYSVAVKAIPADGQSTDNTVPNVSATAS